jgi:5S rRNA maturation endonuclease (ribonuclease M5)
MNQSKGLREIIEEIYRIIEKERDTPIIVEGKKDQKALIELGFKRIIPLNGRSLYNVAEAVSAKRVIILTDLDAEGKEIYSYLAKHLGTRGVYVDNRFRELLFKTELRQIEGLTHYLNKFGN